MAGIVQHHEIDLAIHAHIDAADIAHFKMIRNGADRALLSFAHIDGERRMIGQEGATPAARPEC